MPCNGDFVALLHFDALRVELRIKELDLIVSAGEESDLGDWSKLEGRQCAGKLAGVFVAQRLRDKPHKRGLGVEQLLWVFSRHCKHHLGPH